MTSSRHSTWLAALALATLAGPASAACCYFSAKNADILQPAQKVFLTYDPAEKVETFTVQPKFEGNALDFGMVIPTPSQPKLHEMPKEFFKHLAVYTILKKRESPQSKLLPLDRRPAAFDARWRVCNAAMTRRKRATGTPQARPRSASSKPASSAPWTTRSSKRTVPTLFTSGSRTTSITTPATRPRSTTTSRRSGSSPS